jgi:hypothetical protein
LKTYHPNETVPAAAITLATHSSSTDKQPILFTTQEGYQGEFGSLNESEESYIHPLKWVIRSVTINLVRDWSTSTFEIVLSCNLPENNKRIDIPRLPYVKGYREGDYPYLDKEDEIRIYMGYINNAKTPITADLLDRYPFNLPGQSIISNPKKPLCPVFWGFIDKIDFIGDRAGAQLVISGRDRARVFQDTRVLSVSSLNGSAVTGRNEEGKIETVQGSRSKILLDVARAAVGHKIDVNNWSSYEEESIKYWKWIIGSKDEESTAPVMDLPAGDYSEVFSKVIGDDPSNIDRNLLERISPEYILKLAIQDVNSRGFVRFHRWVFRPPIAVNGRNAVYQIFNRVPIDIINYLGSNEERPIDFYCSHVNGDFLFAPRILDTTGLEDPDRNYRTYFYKSWPKEIASPPSHGQLILKIRSVSSTLGTFNRVSISSTGVAGRGEDTLAALSFMLENYGMGLRNRNPYPPSRHQLIVDDNLNTYNNALVGATTIAFQASRSWNRELNAVQMTIIGDPTFYPGEAVRVYNSVLHDYDAFMVKPDPAGFEKAVEDFLQGLPNTVEQTLGNPRQASERSRNNQSTDLKDLVKETEEGEGQAPDLNTFLEWQTNKDENRYPIYKCRSIRHRLTTVGQQAGFTTELALVGDL